MMDNNTQTPNAKVAIPKLNRPTPQPPPRKQNLRQRGSGKVNKACLECRKRKIKCSGTLPSCTTCQRYELECLYELKRRDRLREALRRNETLVALLKDVSVQLDDEHKHQIATALENLDNEIPPISPSSALRTTRKRPNSSLSSHNTEEGASSFHVIGDVYAQDSGGPGYIGRNSVTQWLRSLQKEASQPQGEHLRQPPGLSSSSTDAKDGQSTVPDERHSRTADGGSITNYNFYLDEDSIDTDMYDCHILPPANRAIRLFGFYEKAVQTPFPILCKAFKGQLHTYYKNLREGNNLPVCDKWKATLNLVCAIGARYAYLTSVDRQRDGGDHLIYMWRAVSLLEMHHNVALTSFPNFALIRATGLLSFYFLAIGHVSRAWHMIGTSIRYAQAAGLHLIGRNSSVSPERKKVTQQLWWSLRSIECMITSITGRPNVSVGEDYTVIPPGTMSASSSLNRGAPSQEGLQLYPNFGSLERGSIERLAIGSHRPESSTLGLATADSSPGTFMGSYLEINLILRKALDGLYSTSSAHISGKKMRRRTTSLLSTLEEWAQVALPHQTLPATSNPLLDMDRKPLLLSFYHYSVMITITRPFMRRTGLRSKEQSQKTIEFNKRTAETCVQAALGFTSLLPETPDPSWLCEHGPWWSSVHDIMQATIVLSLELSVELAQLSSMRKSDLSHGIHKLSLWLQSMAIRDAISRRAYTIMCQFLKEHGHPVPSALPESSAENATQQDNANTSGNMTNEMLDDMTDCIQRPTAALNTTSNQSAYTLWPHGWPDDVSFPDTYPNNYNYSEMLPSMVPDQPHLDPGQDQMASLFEPFINDLHNGGVMPWDLPECVFQQQ